MMKIVEHISLKSTALNANLQAVIIKTLKGKYLNQCKKEYGYILSVKDDIEILDNRISDTGETTFLEVSFHVETLKPKKGDLVTGEICLVCPSGILVEVKGKFKVLIPTDQIKDGKTRSVGEDIEVYIKSVTFENNNFNCIGSLKKV